MNCKMKANSLVNPTEDIDKVIEAISNVFQYDDLIIDENQITILAVGNSCFETLKDSLASRNVQETALRLLLKGIKNNQVNFKLSKQAAFAGKINILDDELSTLGEIEVSVECEDPEEFANWICSC